MTKEIKEKPDFKPIIFYVILGIGIPFIIGFVYGIVSAMSGANFESELEKLILYATVISEAILFIIFMVLYGKKMINDFKKLKLKDFGIILLIGFGLIAINEIISTLLIYFEVPMGNQDLIVDMLGKYPIIMAIFVCILAPVIEELICRYSIGTVISDKKVFLIVSSIIFGALHGVGIATILYIVIGLILGMVYLKFKKNSVAPMIVHMLNNVFSIVLIFLGL